MDFPKRKMYNFLSLFRDAILLVVKEEITQKLNTNISYLLKTRTYLKWPDEEKKREHFWMKLKQSLQVFKPFSELLPHKKRLRLNSM